MIISHQTKSIFVHIQKTGGSSIEEALRKKDGIIGDHLFNGKRHLFARDMKLIVGPEIWEEYYKFAFVRNPWDRLVSWYHMCQQYPSSNKFTLFVKEHAPTFHCFVTKAIHGIGVKTTHDQLDYITDESGNIIVDYIGKYETLQEDYLFLKNKLALPDEIPHVNSSKRGNYREYYTEETMEIVAKRFQRDIDFWKYEF
jgi:chondroitin 4-sulfotransferase 11